jgi:hypothetical protein
MARFDCTCRRCGREFLGWRREQPYCSSSCFGFDRKYPSLEERFWKRVHKSDGCWEFSGGRHQFGYGLIQANHKCVGAHRVSWEIHFGPIPDGLWVLHACDNPSCVRPDHLFLGTVGDNTRDASAKGRLHRQSFTHCPRGHLYSEGYPAKGRQGRKCRQCHMDRRRVQLLACESPSGDPQTPHDTKSETRVDRL